MKKETEENTPKNLKIEVVKLVKERDREVSEVAYNLGIHLIILNSWI